MLLSVDGEDVAFDCLCGFLFPLVALEGVACFLFGDCMLKALVRNAKNGEESKLIL